LQIINPGMNKTPLLIFLLFPAWLFGQYTNIIIGTELDPNEPSIFINPVNPLQIVAGSNTANVYYSHDGGQSWNSSELQSTYGVYGDPVILADTQGNFFFFHLSMVTSAQWLDRIVCQRSTDGGVTWDNGSFMGLNGTRQQDKQWGVVNPANNHIYVTWTQFDHYGSTSPNDSSHIMFSRSVDGGMTWSPAKRINRYGGDCVDEDNTVEGAVPAAGPNGEVYVAWAGPQGLVFTRSADGGMNWPAVNTVIGPIPGGWDFSVPGIYRCNGLPFTCCDLSQGPNRGNIYINWSDQRNGTTDTDVWFVRSVDGGTSWSAPLRVNNDPPGKQQFFTSMTIDPVTGYIYIVFYDRRYRSGNATDVWMAVSKDGGISFSNFQISESPFTPAASIFFGDYTHISAYNNIVRPIWTRLQNGNLTVMTALVDSIFTSIAPEQTPEVPLSLDQNYPNPAVGETFVSFKLRQPSRVSLVITDISGKILNSLLSDANLSAGKHIERFNPSSLGLKPGFYLIRLISGEQTLSRKMVVN
jgi:hypothetical protein